MNEPMRLAASIAGLLLFVGSAPVAAEEPGATAALEIVIENVSSARGAVVVALTSSAEQFEGDAFFRADEAVAIVDGRATRRFDDVPIGTYAVKVFHDENGNGELDTNFVGYPKEGFGFSNDAMGAFGPPSFDAAAFDVEADPTRIRITLR